MLRDNLAGLIEPMIDCAGVHALMDSPRLATAQHESHRTIDPQCLENPRPEGAESTLTENAPSPFQAEPRHGQVKASTQCGTGARRKWLPHNSESFACGTHWIPLVRNS
jgi:hypothetical protein